MAGRPVYGVTLYRRMAQRWLERDGGKHHIRPEHKLKLAAHLAAHLWQTGGGLLPAEGIEDWFHAWLESEPALRRRYADLHKDQLDEDLRTATFLARQDDGGKSSFRFAHTSLLEFFLANYLLQAIRDDAPGRWAMQRPSAETLDFLGQLLAEAQDPGLLRNLQGWRSPYRPGTSELLLGYALRAHERGWPLPSLRGIALTGARLDEWTLRSPPQCPPLDLRGADLTGASLRRAVFERVRLAGASLRETRLVQANFLDCDASGVDWSGTQCTAAIWRRTRLLDGHWADAHGYRPQFLLCDGRPTDASGLERPRLAPQTVPQLSEPKPIPMVTDQFVADSDPEPEPHLSLRIWSGHAGLVLGCAFSPDGTRLLSAGADGTLRLWDAAGGDALLTLSGHAGWVWGCAFSPDGTRLLSAGADGTLRLWDAAGGDALLVMRGHAGLVLGCAFSPDGTRLLSAGGDGTLRLWDAAGGDALLAFRAHAGLARGCAFSLDGTRLLSAGSDGTLGLWDAQTGELLRIHAISGHGYEGHAVWDPRDNRLIEACGDAWRWLAWVRPGPDGFPERLPLETFGPMPEPKRLKKA